MSEVLGGAPVVHVLAATGGETGTILLQLGAVIVALAVLGRVAARFGISPVPFYLVVGLLASQDGPFDLGATEEFIETGAAIGVALLLFMLGVEYAADELVDALRTHAASGLLDLVLNFTPGLLVGLLIGLEPVAAFALGGVTYISSSGIIAKVLADLGRTGNRETPGILSLLVFEDLVMAFYLPLLAGLLAGGSAWSTGASIGVALVVVVVVMAAAFFFGPTLSRLVFSQSSEVLLFSILGLTLVVAGIAEELQVSGAVGAFLVGIALSGPAADRAEPLLAPLRDLFAAAFFVFFGIEIDLSAIPDALPAALTLVLITAATKVATGVWGARRAGVGIRGRWRAGATLIARGEFSVVIAGLAVASGVEGDLGPIAGTYVLVLGLVGPVAARVSDPLARWWERRRAAAATG